MAMASVSEIGVNIIEIHYLCNLTTWKNSTRGVKKFCINLHQIFIAFYIERKWVDGICGSGQSGTVKKGVWKMQEWTYRHDMARVDNAGGKNVSKLA